MGTKKIKNLDSLMVFTGVNAKTNALALENREYDIFSDEHIGTLKLDKNYDSVFTKTQTEIFVETTPRYKSFKDVTQISYAYIINKSKIKPTDYTSMYINDEERGEISFLYDFEKGLSGKIENAETVPFNDVKLYFTSLNNAMYNKQKFYSQNKEIESLSNAGVKYFWKPAGSYINSYDEDTYETKSTYVGNDYVSYSLINKEVYSYVKNDLTGEYELEYEIDAESGKSEPKKVQKKVLEYVKTFDEIFKNKLNEYVETFKTKHEPEMLSYYLYELNSTLPTIANTYSFGQLAINTNLNFDGEFNNWFDNKISFNVSNLDSNELLKVTPASKYWFNLAIKENGKDERICGDDVKLNSEHVFEVSELKYYPSISILSPYKLKKIDFTPISDKLVGTIDLSCDYARKISSRDYVNTNWIKEKGSLIEEIIVGKEGVDCQIENIIGLEYFTNLKKLDLTGCVNLSNNPDLNVLESVEEIFLQDSNVSVFNPYDGSTISSAKLPSCIESIILNDIDFSENNSLDYEVNDNLTTLELNNVDGIDTLKFVEQWIDALKEAGKLDSGLVNYVNLNGVDWDYVDIQLLRDLKTIELNEFTGNVNVWGPGAYPTIYRKEYRELVKMFGKDSVLLKDETSDLDLNINVVVGEHAFDVKLNIIEQYEHVWQEQNENTGIYETKSEILERDYKDFKMSILDTVTGNSFLDLIDECSTLEDNPFAKISVSNFTNANGIEIGWTIQLPKGLELPSKSEKPESISVGEILLFNSNHLIIATKNIANINQNFTKIGKIDSVDEFFDLLNDNFELPFLYSLSLMEEEIEVPVVNDDNYIDVEYDMFNYIDIEYDQTNYIDVIFEHSF